MVWARSLTSFFCIWISICPRTIRYKDYSFCHRVFLAPLSKSIFHKCKNFSLHLQFYSPDLYIYLYSSVTMSWWLYFAILKSESISLLAWFFFKIVLATLGPLHFHTHFNISLSISVKKPAGMSIGIVCDLWISLGSVINNLTTLSHSVYKHGLSFHVFRFSVFFNNVF